MTPGGDLALIDAGGANLGSVRYALQRLGMDAELTGDAATIRAADRVILPGVGAFSDAMRHLHERGLVAPDEFRTTMAAATFVSINDTELDWLEALWARARKRPAST